MGGAVAAEKLWEARAWVGLLWPVCREGGVLFSLADLDVLRGMGPARATREKAASSFLLAVER